MRSVSATEAARRLSELLDAVEELGETFVVLRRGRPVARIGPAHAANGKAVKEILRSTPFDHEWAAELRELRASPAVEEWRWNN